MSRKTVFIAIQEFCKNDDRPYKALVDAGWNVKLNDLGHRMKKEELPGALQGVDAVLAGVEPYDRDLLSTLPRLKCISRCGVGVDAIDLAAAKEYNIAVLNTVNEVVQPVAEMTVAMILGLARNLSLHVTDFQAGKWTKHTGRLLSEMTVCLVGFGRIGRKVEECLRPFRPKIVIVDPYVKSGDLPVGVESLGFEEALRTSDLVSLHASLPSTKAPLIGKQEILLMKKGAFLVNTARGSYVDGAAVSDALRSGHLAGAAFDVFEEEPYTGVLGKFPQVICTSHVATLTQSSRAAMELAAAMNIVTFFKNAETSSSQAISLSR